MAEKSKKKTKKKNKRGSNPPPSRRRATTKGKRKTRRRRNPPGMTLGKLILGAGLVGAGVTLASAFLRDKVAKTSGTKAALTLALPAAGVATALMLKGKASAPLGIGSGVVLGLGLVDMLAGALKRQGVSSASAATDPEAAGWIEYDERQVNAPALGYALEDPYDADAVWGR